MQKILVIIGSRREGNCYTLGKRIIQALRKERIAVSYITPGNQKIYLCTGCMDCDQSGVCDFTDDMEENINKVKEASTLIFLTPVRWNLLSGDIKIFIDRLNPLYASKGLKGKNAITIAIGAEPKDTYSSEGAISSLGNFFESAGIKPIANYTINQCLNVEDLVQQEETVIDLIEKVKKNIKNIQS